MASYTLEKKLIEAEGITPDIEVDLDIDPFKNTGQDTQIDSYTKCVVYDMP